MFKSFRPILINARAILMSISIGFVLLHSTSVMADEESAIDICMETFWEMYEEGLREELDARFDVVECGKEWNMPYVLIGVTLLACEDALDPTTNFLVRGPEPKSYLPDYKNDKECSIQGPISCGEDWIINTTIDIEFEEDGALGEWKKFVRDDACEIARADFANDQEQ